MVKTDEEQETESELSIQQDKLDDDAVLKRRGYTLDKIIGEGSYAKVSQNKSCIYIALCCISAKIKEIFYSQASNLTCNHTRAKKFLKIIQTYSVLLQVYLAEFVEQRNPNRKQKVACKLVNTNLAPKDFLKKFFPREIEIMSRVNHANLIRVHSIIQRKNKYFVFMQYCENGDLLDFVRNNGAIEEKQARTWFSQMIKGILGSI